MDHVDQRGFDNPSRATTGYVDGPTAARRLGVKRETLYAYASRGLVRSVPAGGGRSRLYLVADLERLKARHDARSGHGPVAAGALRWGEPVLESALTSIGPEGPRYRGRAATELAREGTRFEAAAELLWRGALDASSPAWRPRTPGAPVQSVAALLPDDAPPVAALAVAVAAMAARDPGRFEATAPAELDRARSLVTRMAAWVGASFGEAARVGKALALAARSDEDGGGVAAALAIGIGVRPARETERAIDVALVLSADHELNPSSFTARVAASAGADLYACVGAGLATLSGPYHGGACDRVEALLAEAQRAKSASTVVRERARRGELIPGFGHPLYPSGDPRGALLLETAASLAPRAPGVRTALELARAMRGDGREAPTIDLGLAALAAALGAPPGRAIALFAIGRTAGWIAHAFEQRAAGFVLRPRARYVGS